MGEEKKPEEEKKAVEEKPKAPEEAKKEEKSGDAPAETAAPPPPPPEEVEMRVFMHCEGCARKVKKSLKGFDGVEEVKTDCKTHKVVVKGKKAAEDPMKLVERIQKKTSRKVELLSPLPPPPQAEEPKAEEKKEEEEKPKVEEKKDEPVVMCVVLKIHMHCEACAQEIKKRIMKMKGVQSVETELKTSEVTVKGIFDPPKLVEHVHKRTGKHAHIVRSEPAEKKPDDEKKSDDDKGKDEKKPEGEEKSEKESGDAKEEKKESEESTLKIEQKRNEFYYYYPRYPPMEYAPNYQVAYAPPPQPQMQYAPQIFSDENPNACSVM